MHCPVCKTTVLQSHELESHRTHCGGMWLDHNEWTALKSHNLHVSAHGIASSVWQRKIQEQERRLRAQNRLEKLLGDNDFAELKRIKDWVNTHPSREHLMSFLRNQ